MGRGKAQKSLDLIDACTEILRAIQPAPVRAVCYQLFTRGLIESMAKSETNRVGRQLVDARESAMIPWSWIVDETRSVERVATWDDPERFADAVTRSYRRSKWTAQPVRLEVWSEKGTVRGTLAPILDEYEVPFRVMHGFASATTVQEIAADTLGSGQPLVAIYAGDWDPSGLHMSEQDLPARLARYRANHRREETLREGGYGADWRSAASAPYDGHGDDRLEATVPAIWRVALTAEDVRDPALPSFPLDSKSKDPRHRWYLDGEYGRTPGARDRCWELDALSPVILRERVEAAILSQLDRETWERYVEAEQLERESISRTVKAWGSLAPARPSR